MRPGLKLALVAGVAAVASTATAQQKVTGPVAVYWMSAQTQTGFGMPAMGGGGQPDAGAMMRMMMGGGGGANKSLTLQLGSSQTAAAPQAEHLPPSVLQAGPSLPLLTPKTAPTPVGEPGQIPREYQKPRGKMLIFWGCGERARPGQPVVIDFAQLASNPAAAANAFRGIDFRPMQPPAPGRNRTYGEWPNERTRTAVPSNGSLVGPHTIQGNYSPEISFMLNAEQDFLGPLNLNTNARNAAGGVDLGWNLVGNAQAYLATAVGGGRDTVVMWTSSETQAAGFQMPDYLSGGEITRLVANKTLMGPATRSCKVPKEVLDAMPEGAGLVQLVAYGGEANFVHPPRPADPKVTWNQQWAVKVRYRSATGGMLGMAMPQMPGGRAANYPGAPSGQQPPAQPSKPPSAGDILRKGILGGLPIPRP